MHCRFCFPRVTALAMAGVRAPGSRRWRLRLVQPRQGCRQYDVLGHHHVETLADFKRRRNVQPAPRHFRTQFAQLLAQGAGDDLRVAAVLAVLRLRLGELDIPREVGTGAARCRRSSSSGCSPHPRSRHNRPGPRPASGRDPETSRPGNLSGSRRPARWGLPHRHPVVVPIRRAACGIGGGGGRWRCRRRCAPAPGSCRTRSSRPE